jgi:hypothetical protein
LRLAQYCVHWSYYKPSWSSFESLKIICKWDLPITCVEIRCETPN